MIVLLTDPSVSFLINLYWKTVPAGMLTVASHTDNRSPKERSCKEHMLVPEQEN